MAVKAVPDVDLLDPSLYRKGIPHELYAELREVGPVLWHPRTHVPAYGSDIEFDAQGEFVGIAASVYRISRDRTFLRSIFEPVVRATRFIDVLRARTNALYDPGSRFHGLLAPSISHEGYSKPSYSYWDD